MHEFRICLVTGGPISSIGKGLTTCSVGQILQALGLVVTVIKIDPYLNVDAGLLSPSEHGEVYVLDDGSEVDLDFGNYERMLGIRLNTNNSITGGKVSSRKRRLSDEVVHRLCDASSHSQ